MSIFMDQKAPFAVDRAMNIWHEYRSAGIFLKGLEWRVACQRIIEIHWRLRYVMLKNRYD